MKKIILEQKQLDFKLASLFHKLGIQKFRLLSLGNSIGSGYSMTRTIEPLLLRNKFLKPAMEMNDISLDVRHFARAQNNNDEHIFSWIATNIKESEIHKMNQNDYSNGPTSMPSSFLSQEELEKYYPIEMDGDIGLQDALLESKQGLANIVIYNGCTGSFLDNATRDGKVQHKLTYGINRDIQALESTLKFVQANNRKDRSETQIYICGAPDYLGLKVTEIINMRLKKVAKKYANTTYIKPVKSKLFYQPLEIKEDTSTFKKYFKVPDIHYDEKEYLEFNNHIIQSIYDSYLVSKTMIIMDRELAYLSSVLELERQMRIEDQEYIQQYIEMVLSSATSKITDDAIKKYFYKRAKSYFMDRFPYDFYYLGKKNIENSFLKIYTKK